MLNSSTIIRRLVTIDPPFQPTRSLLALLHAVTFVESQLSERKVSLSAGAVTKITEVKNLTSTQIIERPTLTMESIRNALIAIRAELPTSGDLRNLPIPETVDSMRYVSSVEALANSLLAFIRGLDLLPVVN